MTLISCIVIDNFPILFGDLLTSVVTKEASEILLPTKGYTTYPETRSEIPKPFSLCQKINLLSPKLAIAWAGNQDEAKNYFSQIVNSKSHINPNKSKIYEITNEIDESIDLQIIGLMCLPNGELNLFYRGCEEQFEISTDISRIISSGSGAQKLFDFAKNTKMGPSPDFLATKDKAICNVLSIIAQLLPEEIENISTNNNLFGAGYEIVYFDGIKLVKFSDITYVFWKISVDINKSLLDISPFLIQKYYYEHDFLVIRSHHVNNYNATPNMVTNIAPLLTNPSSFLNKIFHLQTINSRNLLSIFFVTVGEKVITSSVLDLNQTDDNCRISFDEPNPGEISFKLDKSFLEEQVKKLVHFPNS